MRRLAGSSLFLIALTFLQMAGCSKQTAENPFSYPFIRPLHLKREAGKPYSEYRAFYVLTEDFEPAVESASDLDGIREVLKFASDLSSQYNIPWTHFVDVNALGPAFLSDDQQLKQRCQAMIADLARMTDAGDDCELHLHGPMSRELLDYVRADEKLHINQSGIDEARSYRQRKSFFFQSFHLQGYRQLVSSLSYGKKLLERCIYDGKKQVLAFRPGGWDHGSSAEDTLVYFLALSAAGLTANSGLSTGNFGDPNWRVGNDPGHNLATVLAGEELLFEVSPTAGPGGYVNPVLPSDLNKLSRSINDEMVVIVVVYHLAALQRSTRAPDDLNRSEADLQKEREALEMHFKTVADLTAAKVLYPVTLRELLATISEQQ